MEKTEIEDMIKRFLDVKEAHARLVISKELKAKTDEKTKANMERLTDLQLTELEQKYEVVRGKLNEISGSIQGINGYLVKRERRFQI
jgi:hypothetical protein